MGAKDDLGGKLLDKAGEFPRAIGAKGAFPAGQFSDQFGIVHFVEDHAPNFRSMGDQFDVAFAINFFVERRKQSQKIQTLDFVLRTEFDPGLLESGGGLEMSSSRRDG